MSEPRSHVHGGQPGTRELYSDLAFGFMVVDVEARTAGMGLALGAHLEAGSTESLLELGSTGAHLEPKTTAVSQVLGQA